jgi:aquaporin NIP
MSTSKTLSIKGVPSNILSMFLAELIGTMFLAATAATAMVAHLGLVNGYTSLYVPFAIGGVVMVLVYTLGHVSGAHFNPAVSAGLFAFKKIGLPQLISDFVAQFVGAWLGIKLMTELVGVGPATPNLVDQPTNIAEFLGAFLLVFAVTNLVLGRIKAEVGGIVIGMALAIGLTLAMVTGGGILNPAIAAASGAPFGIAYTVMPLLGGLVGAAVAVLFDNNKQE